MFCCKLWVYPESHPNKHLSPSNKHLLSECKQELRLVPHWRWWNHFHADRSDAGVRVRRPTARLILSQSTYHIRHFLCFLFRQDFHFDIGVVELPSHLRELPCRSKLHALVMYVQRSTFAHEGFSRNVLTYFSINDLAWLDRPCLMAWRLPCPYEPSHSFNFSTQLSVHDTHRPQFLSIFTKLATVFKRREGFPNTSILNFDTSIKNDIWYLFWCQNTIRFCNLQPVCWSRKKKWLNTWQHMFFNSLGNFKTIKCAYCIFSDM